MEIPAFLASEYPPTLSNQAGFHIISAPLEQSVSYGGGTARGPQAILHASQQLEAWDGISAPGTAGLYTAPPLSCQGSIEETLKEIEHAVAYALSCHAIPVLLGGEHTVSLGAFRAFAKDHTQPFGIIHFDAHADLRPTYEGSPYSHACVMYRAITDLHIPLAQFGTRDYCQEEAQIRQRHAVISYDATTLAREGLPLSPLPDDFPHDLYISFDVDGFDASLMPATGTPSPGGLFWHEALTLIERCCQGRRIIGLDVVELAPIEHLHHPDFTAAKLTHALMGFAQRCQRS